jgi:hypothetical protein
MPAQANTYELLQCQPEGTLPGFTNLFGFDELVTKVAAASDGAHDILFENLQPNNLTAGEPYRRSLSSIRNLYRPDDLGQSAGNAETLLTLGTLESLALPGVVYRLALTPGLIPLVLARAGAALLPQPANILASTATDGGGYVDLDGNGNWWIPSSRVFFSPDAGTPQQESAAAYAHFFLPRRFVDAFGNATVADYDDPHDLLVIKTTDALSNIISQQQTHAAQQINFIIRSLRQREPRESAGSLIRAPWRSSD